MTDDTWQDWTARHALPIAAAALVVVAVPLGIVRGAPSVVLWFGFALLAAAAVMFWETLRLLLDPLQPGDHDHGDDDGAALASLEERKRSALAALKDLEFERSIGRLGDDDYKALETRYREEARAAMKAMDEGIGPWRARAEALVSKAAADPAAASEPKAKAAAKAPAAATDAECAKCHAANDADAVFCKKCGARIAPEADHAG